MKTPLVKLSTKEQWAEWLEKMHVKMDDMDSGGRTRYETAASVLDITTYDSDMDKIMVDMMMPTLLAIGDKTTFELVEGSPEQYKDFIITVNLPICERRLNWGTSIRGAWWCLDNPFDPHDGTLGVGGTPCDLIEAEPIKKGEEESFVNFLNALNEFIQLPELPQL